LVGNSDAPAAAASNDASAFNNPHGGIPMYVAVVHRFLDPEVAFKRGERLIKQEGVPQGVRVLQFYPDRSGWGATCLWESTSVGAVQGYVDETLGDSTQSTCFEVDAEHAFTRQPLGIAEPVAAIR
jgi:hypothetical protein